MKSFKDVSQMMSAQRVGELILQSRLPQTILLVGEAGCGKFDLAKKLTAALLCTASRHQPCGKCIACHKVQEGIHPDVIIIDEEDKEIRVERARELRAQVNVLPNDGERRVSLIRHAHRMNRMAQNALLKTLEEPPKYAFFILMTEQPEALLQTIRSRCTRYDLAPRQEAQLTQEDSQCLKCILEALAKGNEAELLRACVALEKLGRIEQKNFLQFMQIAIRDTVFVELGLTQLLLPQVEPQIRMLAQRVTSEQLLHAAEFMNQLAEKLDYNASAAAFTAALCAGCYEICWIKK